MKTFKVKIENRSGLHARPASRFVQTCMKFKSNVTICKSDKCANAKNILQVLALGIDCGDEATIKIDGEDEETAFNEILTLLTKILPEEDK